MSNISGDGGSYSSGNTNGGGLSLIEEGDGGSYSSGNTNGGGLSLIEEGQQTQLPIVNNSHSVDIGSISQEHVQDSSKKKKRSLPGTPANLRPDVSLLGPPSIFSGKGLNVEFLIGIMASTKHFPFTKEGLRNFKHYALKWRADALKQRTATLERKTVVVDSMIDTLKRKMNDEMRTWSVAAEQWI
ncbi:hypothetical protein Tco_0555632 [Tanacetum coccineum]